MARCTNLSVEPSGPSTMSSILKVSAATPTRSTQVLEQPVELVQSLNLIQTTVCAVVSTVASLRQIFPAHCFRGHRYDIEDPSPSYKDFMEAIDEEWATRASPGKTGDYRFIPLEILVRGRDVGANKLLDWMELGMTDALSHKYLDAMQLSVYDGEVTPTKRLEAYIMNFSYTESSAEMTLHLSGQNGISSPLRKTISSTKNDLRFLVHRLSYHVGGFPKLSPRSVINMHLTYNDTCPPLYEPPGFVMCQEQELVLQSGEGAFVGSVHPGPHSMDLRIFLNESYSKTLTSVATLRGPASAPNPVDSTLPKEIETAGGQEGQPKNAPVLATLHPTQEVDQQLSQLSHITSGPDTQERGQLAAIDSMARLRFAQHDPHDTQMLDVIASASGSRHGSVNLDGESTVWDGSSTQGTPSTVGGRRSARLALKSTTQSLPNAPTMPKRRKRQSTPAAVHSSADIHKVSGARSPFARKCSAKLRKVSEAGSPFTRKCSEK